MIARTLWYGDDEKRSIVNHEQLLEYRQPLVILGEAGMGKSTLLEWLCTNPRYVFCTANKLINRPDPKTIIGEADVLVIDALDERMAKNEGDALDQVLCQLGRIGYPPFILSCRVADWRSATAIDSIKEQYDDEPLLLHIDPLTDAGVKKFLTRNFGDDFSDRIIEHFLSKGLSDLLGNPQTLHLIAKIAEKEELPETKQDLFEKSIEYLVKEHNDKHESKQLDKDLTLDFAGAAFATLILTGKDTLVRRAAANIGPSELLLSEIDKFSREEVQDIALSSRLFKGIGADRFSYSHRRVGEYLAARWLARRADTERKRRRLLKMLYSYGLVPAGLRGVHAWLAIYPEFSNQVIAADPIGVMEYGDADSLNLENARTLIKSLQLLTLENPYFRGWNTYLARGIAKPQLIDELKQIICSKGASFQLRVLVIESIKDSPVSYEVLSDLRALVVDREEIFACRKAASEVLAVKCKPEDCSAIIRTIYGCGDDLSLRLAIEFSNDIHYENLDDQLIFDMAFAYAKSDSHTIGVLWTLERNFPLSRLDDFLDCLARQSHVFDCHEHKVCNEQITDLAFHLIARRIADNKVTAEKLWMWLEPFNEDIGYEREPRKKLSCFLLENHDLRRSIQKLVLLDTSTDKSIWQRYLLLRACSIQLAPTEEDVIFLLGYLDSSNQKDDRWRELVQCVYHSKETGEHVREAAKIFAFNTPEAMQWLDNLPKPKKSEWEVRNERENQIRLASKEQKLAELLEIYTEHLEDMRRGDSRWLIDPAKAYLNLLYDVDGKAPPHRRIALWLNEDIAAAAHEGFEKFLMTNPVSPTSDAIVKNILQRKYWESAYIFIAALAERLRNRVGFTNLSHEQLTAGFFHLQYLSVEHQAGIKGLEESVRTEVKRKGLWLYVLRQYVEPQLYANLEDLNNLYSFIDDSETLNTSADLLFEWLGAISNLTSSVEIRIIDRLLRSNHLRKLEEVANSRSDIIDAELKRTWEAVKFIVNFEATELCYKKAKIEPELLWHIQARTGERYNDHLRIELTSEQMAWVVRNFRSVWPYSERSNKTRDNCRKSWEASEYLSFLVRQLANNIDDSSIKLLNSLKDMPTDGYTETIKSLATEQRRKRTDSLYNPISIEEIFAVIQDSAPRMLTDLQEVIMAELSLVQQKIRSDDVDSWRGFFDDSSVPHTEERCRDHLLGLLRQSHFLYRLVYHPETHVAADKEVDFTCSVGNLRLPVEIKGQWNSDLWHAVDSQLNRLYSQDWQAEQRGIYLVLWFGKQANRNKKLKGLGRGVPLPESPEELRSMLVEKSVAVRDGKIEIFVMDIARPK